MAEALPGVALVAMNTDGTGIVRAVLRDDLGLFAGGASSLPALVTPAAIPRAFELLERARREEAVADFVLEVKGPGGPTQLRFAAARVKDGLCLVASTTAAETELLDELVEINNEHITELRLALKRLAVAERRDGPLDELMALNNEMAALQRELAKKNARLVALDEQKNRLLGMAAHDLRNPIGAIQGYAEFLLEDFAIDDPEQRELLGKIHDSAGFMLALLSDLLDVSAIEAGEVALNPREVALEPLLRQVTDTHRSMGARKDITVELLVEGALGSVRADPLRLAQVLQNLLSNAVKYSHAGTRVELRAHRADGVVVLAVADEGQGIPEGELETLFEPWSTTSVKATAGEKSTGLGLAIVKKSVEAHGGRIAVTSAVGEGTTFTIHLPVDGPARPTDG